MLEKINFGDTDTLYVLGDVIDRGEPTFNEYTESEGIDRIAVLDSPEKMPYYAEISVGENDFILPHGGLEDFSPDRPLDDYSRDEIVWAEPDFKRGYFEDKFVIIGHTPTPTVCGEPKIFRTGKLIDINCGWLGCLCLDNSE